MLQLYRILSWKVCLRMALILIPIVIVFSFYGLYSGAFYLFNPANYIIPFLTLIHLAYLYVFWFKVKEDEFPDPRMRILEYLLYGVLFFYLLKIAATIKILLSRAEFESHVIPDSFYPMGYLVIGLHAALILFTLMLIRHRKEIIGAYNVDYLNEKIDEWPG